MKNYLSLLVIAFWTLAANAQKTKLVKNDCQSTMRSSISEVGENGQPHLIPTKENEFNIHVDQKLKPVSFISSSEKYYRSQAKKVDTSIFYLIIPNWKNLSPAQKLILTENERAKNEELANSANKNNNINHQLIYMVNNTSNDVALQMMDYSFMGVLEARISPNNWRSVQYINFSKCGNSYNLKHIASGHKAYFITPVLTGNYKTTLRYKILGKNQFYYSNEFEGNINICDLYDTKYSPQARLETFVKYNFEDN